MHRCSIHPFVMIINNEKLNVEFEDPMNIPVGRQKPSAMLLNVNRISLNIVDMQSAVIIGSF